MNLVNRFIDWRKNIDSIEYYGISLFFDPRITSLMDVKSSIYDSFNMIPDPIFRKRLNSGDISYSESNYAKRYECFQDYSIDFRPKSPYSFGLSHVILEKRKLNRIASNFKMNTISQDLLSYFSSIKGLSLMISYNPNYKSWDNNHIPTAYKYKKGIKIYYDKRFDMLKVDISNRPGRIAEMNSFAWHGGHEYWFGNGFYDIIPKEHILQFKYADEMKELPNGLVYTKLMNMHDYWTDEGQSKLLKLRTHLGIDALEKEYLEKTS